MKTFPFLRKVFLIFVTYATVEEVTKKNEPAKAASGALAASLNGSSMDAAPTTTVPSNAQPTGPLSMVTTAGAEDTLAPVTAAVLAAAVVATAVVPPVAAPVNSDVATVVAGNGAPVVTIENKPDTAVPIPPPAIPSPTATAPAGPPITTALVWYIMPTIYTRKLIRWI